MTDLEMTRLCAEAMGYTDDDIYPDGLDLMFRNGTQYAPLHNDAQTMVLVKKFRLGINASNDDYQVWSQSELINRKLSAESCTFNPDLNHAICECVAKMQAAKVRP